MAKPLDQIARSRVHPGLVLLALAPFACADPNQGVVGAVDACYTAIAEYEQAQRPRVSPVTGVDTGVPVGDTPVEACCPSDDHLRERELLNGRTLTLPVDAARFPWVGQCWDADGLVCDRCNLCPYGAATHQGTWVDTDRGQPTMHVDEHNRQANRLDFDGNTFRWRYKNRQTGHWVEFRGHYYCSEPFRHGVFQPGMILVPLEVSRGDGLPCVFDPRTDPAPHEPFPRIAAGEPIAVVSDHVEGYELLLFTPAITMELTANGPFAPDIPFYSLALCSPSGYIGPAPPWVVVPVDTDCPDLETFTACWEAGTR